MYYSFSNYYRSSARNFHKTKHQIIKGLTTVERIKKYNGERIIVCTVRKRFLLRRISGPRPHAAKATMLTAGTNWSTRGLPRKALHDLHHMMEIVSRSYILKWKREKKWCYVDTSPCRYYVPTPNISSKWNQVHKIILHNKTHNPINWPLSYQIKHGSIKFVDHVNIGEILPSN